VVLSQRRGSAAERVRPVPCRVIAICVITMSSYLPLRPALAEFNAEGTLFSSRYGDVYHSSAGALAQAEYVFLRGNGLPQRWRGRPCFTVCETGFGLGMNFLALWRAWRDDPGRCRRLHMVSIEAHPFPREVLASLLAARVPPALATMAQALIQQWPPLLPGLHRLEFDRGNLTLTLAFGDASTMVQRLGVGVDAYFLDGFAPSCNPDMWTPALLRDLARYAVAGASVATWSSAGAVRRGLMEAGFAIRRERGLGGKRHMTVSVLQPSLLRRPPPPSQPGGHHAVIIGGGLAGAGVAQALALRGWRVTVIEAQSTANPGGAATHDGHLAAALTPVMARDDNARARLARAGSLRAQARWGGLDIAAPLRCGTLQLARAVGRVADLAETVAVLRLPADWVRLVDKNEASDLAGMPVARGGLYWAAGMLVQPVPLIQRLLKTPGVTLLPGVAARLQAVNGGWQVLDATGQALVSGGVVVLANGIDVPVVLQASGLLRPLLRLAALHRLAGEITLLPATALGGGPRCIVGGAGYLLPNVEGWCVAGSTYVNNAQVGAVTVAGQEANLDKAAGLLATGRAGLASLQAGHPSGMGRVARCATGAVARCGGVTPCSGRMAGYCLRFARIKLGGACGRLDCRQVVRRARTFGV